MATLRYGVDLDIKSAQNSLNSLQRSIGGLATSLAGAFAGFSAFQITKNFEDLRTSLNILYKDVQRGNAVFEDIKNFAKSSVFSVDSLTQTVIKLKAAGLEPTIEQLRFFADVSSVAADSMGALQAITDLYARTTEGGLGLEDLNRLADRGIPVFKVLGDTLGLSRLQISKLGETAEGAQLILRALEQGLAQTFAGSSAQRANNVSQAVSNLGDTFSNLVDTVGRSGLNDAIVKFVRALDSMLETLNPLIIALGKGFSLALEFVAENLKIVTAAAIAFFAVMSVNAIINLAKAFNLLALAIGKSPIGKILTGLTALAAYMGISALETQDMTKQLEDFNEEAKKSQNLGLPVGDAAGSNANIVDLKGNMIDLNQELKKFRIEMESITASFKAYNNEVIQGLELDARLLGQSRELADIEKSRAEIMRRSQEEIRRLTEAKAKLTKQEIEEGRAAIIDEQIQKIREATEADIQRTETAIKGLERVTAAEQLRLFGLKEQIDLENQLMEIQDDIAKMTMTEIEQKYYDIEAAAKRSAKAAIEAEAARRGISVDQMDTATVKAYYDAAVRGSDRLKDATRKQYEESRKWSTGWKQAFNEYVNNATNAAKQAEKIFTKFTSGIEDLLVNFVKTGKFEWKNFVADMLETLLRSQIQQAMANIFNASGLGSGGGGFLDTLGSLLGFGGDSGQQRGQTSSAPLYVYSVNGGIGGGGGNTIGSLVGGGGGTDFLGGALNRALGGGSSTGGGFFSNIIGGVSNVVSGISNTIGNVVSGISDFFGGFFANGGSLPAGKFGIVGERGPELITGPANITPMGMGGSVTYNINAVDAQSFKQLIAADPSFIHAVAMQGARGIPSRR